MKKINNIKSTVQIFLVTLIVTGLMGIYQLSLVFSESLHFNKYSWSYFTILIDEIKNIPVYKTVDGSTTFRYGIGDGTTDTTYSVIYKSQLSKVSLLDKYKQFFESNGQLKVRNPLWPNAIFYEASNGRYQVDVEETGDNMSLVNIEFFHIGRGKLEHPLKDPE